jgi:NAD(P)-dependent dehydrogenase (short-subunit alcohol dehydrogenase family)
MYGNLEGKVALVTGGSSGIGRASALVFGRKGAKVIVTDLAVDGGEKTVKTIVEEGGEAIFIKGDVSNRAEVEILIERAVETYGRLDCAFNNAGVAQSVKAPTADYTEEDWDRVMKINLKGVWLCMKYEIRQMLKQGGGSIVNCSSVAGLRGFPARPAYAASKHGVIGLTKTAAVEYADAGIRINAVCPGWIRTPMVKATIDLNPEVEGQIASMQPIGRIGSPKEVAEVVVWLCSDGASFVIGHCLIVDGGSVADSMNLRTHAGADTINDSRRRKKEDIVAKDQ